MVDESLLYSPIVSKLHRLRVKTVAEDVRFAFGVDDSDVTPAWLAKWNGLLHLPMEQYPKELGISVLAQLRGDISWAHTLMLRPLKDGTWGSRVRDCIMSLSAGQRMAVSEYLKLFCDLGYPEAKYAWTSLWSDIADAGGDMYLVWPLPFGRSRPPERWFYSRPFHARVERTREEIQQVLLDNASPAVDKVAANWKGLVGVPRDQYASRLGSAMLAKLKGSTASANLMMLLPAPSRISEKMVRECILSLTAAQRVAAAEYLRLWRDLGDGGAQRAWALLWMDIYEARGHVSTVWQSGTAVSSKTDHLYASTRHRARVKRTAKAVRQVFHHGRHRAIRDLPEDWEGLEKVPLEVFAERLGSAMLSQLDNRVSLVGRMMLLPGFDERGSDRVREYVLSLTDMQRTVVAEFIKLRSDLGDSDATRAWVMLWRDIYRDGGDVSLVCDGTSAQ